MFGLVNIEFCVVLLGYRIIYFVFQMVFLVLQTMNFIFLMTFHFKGIVFGDSG